MGRLQKNRALSVLRGLPVPRPHIEELINLLSYTASDLDRAVSALSSAESVAVVAGFPIPPTMVPENDGILAAVAMHKLLGADVCGPAADLLELRGCGGRYDVVVYVEFPGPSEDGKCHTYSGIPFECPPAPVKGDATIAVGDGGNEFGMGKAIRGSPQALRKIWCTVSGDYLIYAPISELGVDLLLLAQGLGRKVLEAKIGALDRVLGLPDGITLVPNHSIDGVPLMDYFRTLQALISIFEK